MKGSAIGSSAINIIVTRGGQELKSNDEYIIGENLTVSLSDTGKQHVFETSPAASFSGGDVGCEGNIRSYAKSPTLNLPSTASGNKMLNYSHYWYSVMKDQRAKRSQNIAVENSQLTLIEFEARFDYDCCHQQAT
jgi:hypothetical protein